MKISLAQINPTIGAFKENVRKICTFTELARERGADLVIFPEMSIIGYPPKDFLERPRFVVDNLKALDEVVNKVPKGIAVIVGFVDKNPERIGRSLCNAAAFINNGKIESRHYKALLPTYDVFDEDRYFEPVHSVSPVQFCGEKLGITICEDIWIQETLTRSLYHVNPIESLTRQGVDIIINISASPFEVRKMEKRYKLISHQARRYNVPFIYVNQVGGNDDLIFDGNSVTFNREGKIAAQAREFDEDLITVSTECGLRVADCEKIPHSTFQVPNSVETVYKALVLGLKDYVRKCGFKDVVIGLSGGIDSAVTAVLAVRAVGREHVIGVTMPSQFSSQGSVDDARRLAENLGIQFKIISIKELFDTSTKTLRGEFEGLPFDTTEENLQARIRGEILMALSNKYGYLVLSTGNKSELAVGYCTLYGDMCGGMAVISDVPKIMVYDLARYINREKEVIPQSSIDKPPSAELRLNQTDLDSLPPYEILDGILKAYIEELKDADEIIAMGYEESIVRDVIKKVDRNEYKRKQAAPGLKVTSKAFGTGRRMPIAQGYTG
ncbi:MAG: NAD+ synthase [Candidatus Brocadiales bacterium]